MKIVYSFFLNRYETIRNLSVQIKEVSYNKSIKGLVASFLVGLFWSLMPIVGWSEYSLEGAMISCSVEWYNQTPSVLSYNIAIAIFVFFIPIFLLIYTNTKMFCIVSNIAECILTMIYSFLFIR